MKPPIAILAQAVAEHHAKGRGRITLRVPGFSKQEVIDEWNRQNKGAAPREIKVAKGGPDAREDGLDRLAKSKRSRLDPDRLAQAYRYRRLGRLAQLIGGSIRSCLNDTPGGGADGLPKSDAGMAHAVDAKRELLRLRAMVLRGEEDMITVLDAVCLNGMTITTLAGGDGNRGRELMAVLKVALQLLHLEQNPPATEDRATAA